MKFEFLSPNLVIIINTMLQDQEVAKLIYYDVEDPLNQPNLTNTQSLIKFRVFPSAYAGESIDKERTQVRVYYGNSVVKNGVIEKTDVMFEVITHTNLSLIKHNNEPLVRIYELISRITKQFDDVSVSKIGTIVFKSLSPCLAIKDGFQMVRLIGDMTLLKE